MQPTSPDSPISNDAISTALTNLAVSGVSQKLSWWLLSPHAAERWFQFELAYQLDRFLQENDKRYAVLCEIDRADIAVIKLPPIAQPIWNNPAAAMIELKWLGNWAVGGKRLDVERDVSKVDGYQVPAIALVVWLVAEPSKANPGYEWFRDQVRYGEGVAKADEIKTKMQEHWGEKFQLLAKIDITCEQTGQMDGLSLLPYVYRNRVA